MSWSTKILAASVLAALVCSVAVGKWPTNPFTVALGVFCSVILGFAAWELFGAVRGDLERKDEESSGSE